MPVSLDAEGLTNALQEMVQRVDGEHGAEVSFHCPEPVPINNHLIATHLYYVAKEALANAVRHGKAKKIRVSLEMQDGQVSLTVLDDGVGIRDKKTTGLGLRIMHNRAGIIGARLTIDRVQPSGTRVTCIVPRDIT